MKLRDAEGILEGWIDHNYEKYPNKVFLRKLNWEIVKLSHDVYPPNSGLRGHIIRQKIRRTLWRYGEYEMEKHRYQVPWTTRFLVWLRRVFGSARED